MNHLKLEMILVSYIKHRILLEMSYVLILVFGLTDKQVKEIERNDGLTDADIEAD